jgi:hypothetical protein
LNDASFQRTVAELAGRALPVQRPLTLPDEADERRLCQLAWWLGTLDHAGRGGTVLYGSTKNVDGLLSLVSDLATEDLLRLVRAASTGPFARFRSWAAGRQVLAGADLAGRMEIDIAAGGTLLTFVTTTTPHELTRPPQLTVWLRQLVSQALLDVNDQLHLTHLAAYLTRQAVAVRWALDRVMDVCAGPAPRRTLAEHRNRVRALLAELNSR